MNHGRPRRHRPTARYSLRSSDFRDRLRGWSFSFAMLSACWSEESGRRRGLAAAVAVAEVLEGL
jgi:streptomycin 6-kinase